MGPKIVADQATRTEEHGRVLLGGHPFRVMRLSPGGATRVRSWFAGESIPDGDAEVELAGRLVAAGLAHPRPAAANLDCHIVIPYKGPVDELMATLEPLRVAGARSITVVDDASSTPIPPMDGVTVLRHERPAGPGAARNTGWRHVADHHPSARAVLFVDGDVRAPSPSDQAAGAAMWLEQLCGHLSDNAVAAAAPRVSSTPGRSLIERYEREFSPLDLGPAPSLVGPGRLITYVPTACVVVKLAALAEAGGFDESMRYGEDVDLVWRMSATHEVRYDPTVVLHHQPRPDVRAFAAQRFNYATAAADLDQKHPAASAPWKSSLVGVSGVALCSLGRPIIGGLIGFAPVRLLANQLDKTATPMATAARLLAAGHRWSLRSFAESAGRTWAVVGFVALLIPGVRSASIGWMVAGWARRITTTRSPALLGLGVVDDVAYGVGAVTGAVRQRSIRSLLPSISLWG